MFKKSLIIQIEFYSPVKKTLVDSISQASLSCLCEATSPISNQIIINCYSPITQ